MFIDLTVIKYYTALYYVLIIMIIVIVFKYIPVYIYYFFIIIIRFYLHKHKRPEHIVVIYLFTAVMFYKKIKIHLLCEKITDYYDRSYRNRFCLIPKLITRAYSKLSLC